MSNDQPSRRPPAKSSGGGAPMGSTISIVIAVVAVIVGFLILRNINSDDDNSSSGDTPNSTESTTPADQTTTPVVTEPPASTTTLVLQGATVVVANASGQGGAAGVYTTALQSVGFTMGAATNAAAPEQRVDVSKVYYIAGSEAQAASVAQVMSAPGAVIATAPMPTPVPIDNAEAGLNGATVLVMLGKDLAGKPLPALAGDTTTTTTTALTGSPLNSTTTVG